LSILGMASAFVPSPSFIRSTLLNVAVGDSMPSVTLDSGFPPEKVDISEYTKGKKMVIVGLPGAFTPT